MNEWMSEWMNEWMSEWINEWMSEGINAWKYNDSLLSLWISSYFGIKKNCIP
jgi:hypothetical protein